MSDAGSYDASTMAGGLDVELERLREQALLPWPKESRILKWLGLRDGMSMLELGGGPGFVTAQLLEMLPNSRITVVERDPVLIERASKYLERKGSESVRIMEGNVMSMDFPDDTFDFAYARLIFQHLPDPRGAARETLRVLKPGSKLVIGDIDEDLHLFYPPREPEVEAISARFIEEQAAKGGSRHVGRMLPRILRDAGFTKLELDSFPLHSDIVGFDKMLPKVDPIVWRSEVEAGRITEEEMQMLIASDEKYSASEPIAILTILMASGEKPAP
jgi:SAM-dependent methyltransferase